MKLQINIRTLRLILYTFVVHIVFYTQVFCQSELNDSIQPFPTDTTTPQPTQNFDTVSLKFDEDALNEIIHYHASDSIVYDIKNEMLYLYGDAYMDYGEMTVESEVVRYSMESGTLVSEGVQDSTGSWTGTPVFTQGGKTYEANKMEYNFKTQKGKTYDVLTEQDGAYIHSEVVKKNEYDEWYGYHTYYTTCTNKDHPHFYIEAKKSKVIPDKVMITGPANLVVEGVNTPLYLPFGIFPTNPERKSGIIFPEYGEAPSLGFFLRNGGYYWAVNDRLSMAITADIYTRGTFSIGTNMNYNKRYKFDGILNLDYTRTPPTDKLAGEAGKSNDVSIEWRHNMSPKAKPYNSFRASVTGRSSNFSQNTLITSEQLLEVQLSSNINYTRSFRGKPFSFSIDARHNQNLQTNTISITAPEITFNVTRFNPFQSKIKTANKKFYENIGFTYSTRAKAFVDAIDSTLLTKETLDKIQYGIQHRARVDAPFNLFKHFTVTPEFNYTERWYFKEQDLIWNPDTTYFGIYEDSTGNIIGIDTNIVNVQQITRSGFYDVRDFNFQTTITTAITGIYNFKGKRVKAMRHIIKPSLNYTFRPDFGAEKWGYYDTYFDEEKQREVSYSQYAFLTNLYGTPGSGLQNIVNFSMTNNFEIKAFSRKDTVNQFKYIPVIENLSMNAGYDFSADSLKIQPISVNAASSLFNRLFTWNFRSTFSAYTKNDSTNTYINTTNWEANKRFLRLDNFTFSGNFNFAPKGKKVRAVPTSGTVQEREFIANNPNLFYDFNIPWSLRIGYNIAVQNGAIGNADSLVVRTNSITFGGHINITPKWQINVSSGYDLKNKDLTLTNVRVERDLHCWVLAFNWTAYPLNRQTYGIDLHVKSQILQELKLSRKQPPNLSGNF